MNQTEADYLRVLFEPSECIWVSPSKAGSKRSLTQDWAINHYKNTRSNDGLFVALHPAVNRQVERNNTNTLGLFRNFLIEFDDIPLDEQQHIVDSIQLPYSTKVFSGGKSFHYIISLESPLPYDKYEEYFGRLMAIFPEMDSQNKDKARYTRFPNGFREETSKRQDLLEIKGRVKNQKFEEFLMQPEFIAKYNSYLKSSPRKKSAPSVQSKSGTKRELSFEPEKRGNIIKLLTWYVDKYLQIDDSNENIKVQCPVCAQEGRDTSKDNLSITAWDDL